MVMNYAVVITVSGAERPNSDCDINSLNFFQFYDNRFAI